MSSLDFSGMKTNRRVMTARRASFHAKGLRGTLIGVLITNRYYDGFLSIDSTNDENVVCIFQRKSQQQVSRGAHGLSASLKVAI